MTPEKEQEWRYVCLVWDVCDAEVLVGRALMAAIGTGPKFAPTLAEGLILTMGAEKRDAPCR